MVDLVTTGSVDVGGGLDVSGITDVSTLFASDNIGVGNTTLIGRLSITDNAQGIALYIVNATNDIVWPTGQSLQLGDWNGAVFNDRMRINSDGNVGINTISPAGALHVKANDDGVALHLSHALADLSWPADNTLNLGTWDGATFNERMRITSGGNVGIGVSSTPNILTVKQYSSNDPIADSWTTYSSRRWKKQIETLENALDKVSLLRGVSYAWKETGENDIGLIAEEVGEVVPEVVQYEENGIDAQSVDYARLTALLIEAVKELKAENEDLRDKVEHLTTEVESLLDK